MLGFLILFLKGFIVSVLAHARGAVQALSLSLTTSSVQADFASIVFYPSVPKLRKIICGRIAGSGSLEVFDRSPVLQTRAVLKSFSVVSIVFCLYFE